MNSFLRAVLIFVFLVAVNFAILKSAPSLTTIALLLGVGAVLALALGIFTGRIAVSARERQFRPSAGAFAGAPARAPARAAQQPRAGSVPPSQSQSPETRQPQALKSQALKSQALKPQALEPQARQSQARQSMTRQSMKNDGEILNKKDIDEAVKNNEAREKAIQQNNQRDEIIKANDESQKNYELTEKQNRQEYEDAERQRKEDYNIEVRNFQERKAQNEALKENYSTELKIYNEEKKRHEEKVKEFKEKKKKAAKISDENKEKMDKFVKQYHLKWLAQKANGETLDLPPIVEDKGELQKIYNEVKGMEKGTAVTKFEEFDQKIKKELQAQTTNKIKLERIKKLTSELQERNINQEQFDEQLLKGVQPLENEVLLSMAKIEVPTLTPFAELQEPVSFQGTPPEKPNLEKLDDPGQYKPSPYKAIAAPVLEKVPVEVNVPAEVNVPVPILAEVKAQVLAQVPVQVPAQVQVPA